MKSIRIFPEPLKPGSKAAVISLSSPLSDDMMHKAEKSLEFLGLVPKIMPSCLSVPPRPYLAADDAARAYDIISAFSDSDIDGVFCARGGYGCARIMPYLDFSLFSRFPKFLLGSSDLTFLLNAVSSISGLVTFHGPMPSCGYMIQDGITIDSLKKAVFGIASSAGSYGIRLPFTFKRIVGGNLTVLCSMIGTPFEPDFSDAAVFLEDINEPVYKIDRMLTTLILSGRLSDAAGLVFGSFRGCTCSPEEESLLNLIQEEAGSLTGLPVISGIPFGHAFPSITFPIG